MTWCDLEYRVDEADLAAGRSPRDVIDGLGVELPNYEDDDDDRIAFSVK